MSDYVYLLGDADRVRDGIDQRLLSEQLEELQRFSSGLTAAVADLVRAFQSTMRAEVIMAGGDDVLLRIPVSDYSVEDHKRIAADFLKTTGCSMSFGVASRIADAYLNLRLAKAGRLGICFRDGLS